MQHFERFVENIARLVKRDAMQTELERRHAASDANLETSAAQVVEHADLFDQPQRLVKRQQVNQRTEMEALRMLGRSREKDVRRRGHPERGRMMLRDVEAEDPGTVVIFHQLQPFLV